MDRKHRHSTVPRPVLGLSAIAAAVALALAGPRPALAFEFTSASGEVTGSFDTTVSLGGLWRMQSREKSLISIANGGTSRDPNSDDGNLNYKKGELVSSAFKVTHDLEINYRDYGAFVRASYFYDDAIMGKRGLSSTVRREVGRDAEILDAFVRGRFDLGGRDLNVRLGRQVVSWGESTFILNGINVLNPVNVSRLRIPGSELREGLMPTGMLWASQELTDNLTLEAVWMAEWEKTKIDPVGTFFSTNDFVAKGGSLAYTGYGRRDDGNAPDGTFGVSPTAQLIAPRSKDNTPGSGGEYGLALRAFLPELNFTEIGLYHVNYHSRTPYVSGYRGGITATSTPLTPFTGCRVFDISRLLLGLSDLAGACTYASDNGGPGTYFVDYPKNIKLFGISFNTAGPAGIALQGEYSYRRNQPLQLPSAELLNAALGLSSPLTSLNPIDATTTPYGQEIRGYRRVKMHQVQMTATKALPRILGSDQMVMVGEVGYTRLQLPSNMKFAAPGCHLPQPGAHITSYVASFGSTNSNCFATKNSWGYRLLARFDYPNAIGAATLSPRIAFSHDVKGRSPTFNQGAKALTLGLGMNYQQRWQADIAYTSFFGGKKIKGVDDAASVGQVLPPGQSASYASHTNPLVDRDFLSVSVSYSF